MDDDWDLDAVVRGCAATNNGSPTSSPRTFTQNHETVQFDLPAGPIDDHMVNPFEDLQEIYREFCCDQSPPATAAAYITAEGKDKLHSLQQPPQMTKNSQFEINHGFGSSSSVIPSSQPIRPRRRKINEEMKMVREMREEELCADSWAWRKYGQKPIKSSPYPRNYYRCSTSKGCGAKKHVERSPNDPSMFVVSYIGEHTHPRPTHRSSLAGSTRNKLSTDRNKTPLLVPNINNPLITSSPPAASCSSFSSSPPVMEEEAMVDRGDEDEENNLCYESE